MVRCDRGNTTYPGDIFCTKAGKCVKNANCILHFFHTALTTFTQNPGILQSQGNGAATASLHMIPPHTKAIPQKRSLCVPQAQGDLLFLEYGIVNKQKAPGALCVSGAFFAPQADEGPRLHSDRPRSGHHTCLLFTFHSAARGRHFSALWFPTPCAANVQNSGSPKGGKESHCAKKKNTGTRGGIECGRT